jgi:hypothetical protein
MLSVSVFEDRTGTRYAYQYQVQVAKAGPRRHNAVPPLYLIVSKDRKNRKWAFRFTKISTGKVSELGLGDASLLTLVDARDMAHEHRKAVAKGIDPVEQNSQLLGPRGLD